MNRLIVDQGLWLTTGLVLEPHTALNRLRRKKALLVVCVSYFGPASFQTLTFLVTLYVQPRGVSVIWHAALNGTTTLRKPLRALLVTD